MPELGQLAHDVEHLVDHLRVERRGRLVEEHDLAAASPGPGRSPRAAAGRPTAAPGTCAPARGCPRARAAASPASSAALARPVRTRIGARVTFWSTVRCGNRLNDWKTIPISLRMAAMLRMSLVSSMPSTMISPRWCSSSRLMVRMNVDLPEPDGAEDDDHLAGRRRSRSMPRSTCSWPNHLWTSRQTMIGRLVASVSASASSVGHHRSPTPELALEPVAGLRHGVAEDEEHGRDEHVDLEAGAEPLRLGQDGPADAEQLEQADDR